MTVSPYASDAKISEALAAIGAELIGVTEQQLLQQILVAAATASGGGSGGSVAFSAITGSPTDNTNLAAALNAKLNLTGGTLTGPVCIPLTANQNISNIRNAGFLFGSSAAAATAGIGSFNNTLFFHSQSSNDSSIFPMQLNTSELGLASSVWVGWAAINASSTKDLLIGRAAAATLQIGQNHATTPTAQVFKAHNVTTGTGADMSIRGGTGSVADGYVRISTAAGGLAFFGTGGRTQAQGDTQATSSDPVNADTTFDGGSGNTYTIGGIVKVLKEYGILG